MELRHLRYFMAVAGTENITRAAQALHVSQPALSRQIRDLEAELGFPLLERGAKSVRLTAAGQALLPEARAVLERLEEGVQKARSAATGGREELQLGFAMSPTVRILPAALRAFQAIAPGTRVRLHDLSTTEMLTGLHEGKLHLAFLVCRQPARLRGLEFCELRRMPLLLAMGLKHPLARRRSAPLAEVAREPLIVFNRADYPDYHDLLANLFTPGSFQPRIAEEHGSVASLIAAVEAGNGVALVTESMACVAGPRLKLKPIVPTPEPLVVGAAWRADKLTPTAKRFLEGAREVAGTPTGGAQGT